jgi:hypothetical protein
MANHDADTYKQLVCEVYKEHGRIQLLYRQSFSKK